MEKANLTMEKKSKVQRKLDEIKEMYRDSEVVMGELLASISAEGLNLEEAHELYMLAQNYANGDRFYTILGDNEGTFVNCLDETDTITDWS